ncbi:hypothetical protein [Aestuariivirga sp.]|uniref:hypothetical protein n=1 Tax=Aestuariivirga sp. TaxID=2650926 RepID=UPI0039E3A8AD
MKKPQVSTRTIFRAILHIGTPRTGAASLQRYLTRERQLLRSENLAFCRGLDGKGNFKALFHASLSPFRRTLVHEKQNWLERLFQTGRLRRHIMRYRGRHRSSTVIFSCDLLSLLRQRDEVLRLKRLFPPGTEFTIVLCLREPADYLDASARHFDLQRVPRGQQPNLSTYVESDSWLADYDAIIKTYSLISPDIRVIDYDRDAAHGNAIVSAFFRTIGVTRAVEDERGGEPA